MLEAVATQLENNRCQQKQIRRDFNRYSNLAAHAKNELQKLTREQIHLKEWGCRNAKLLEENATRETIDEKT